MHDMTRDSHDWLGHKSLASDWLPSHLHVGTLCCCIVLAAEFQVSGAFCTVDSTSRRSFEEEIDIPVVAVLARQRRRLAAAALAGSLAAGPSAALAQPRYAGRALALVLRALEDEPAFQVRAGVALHGQANSPAESALVAGAARA